MKKGLMLLLMAIFVMFAGGCGRKEATQPPVDVQATVDAAVAATASAEAAVQAAIDEAVQATATIMAQEAAAVATPTPVVVTEVVTQTVVQTELVTTTEIVYVPQEVYVTLSEEELAALIDESVEQAVAATESYAAAAEQAAADEVITEAEVETIDVYVQMTDETVAYIEDLLDTYAELYGTGSEEMILVLQEIEQDLAVIAASSASMASSLDEIAYTLDAGLALAEETIAGLESAAATAMNTADMAQAEVQQTLAELAQMAQMAENLPQNLPQSLPQDLDWLLENTPPSAVANTQIEAVQSLMAYAATVEGALTDANLSPAEIVAIAQAGVNANASIANVNSPQLAGLSNAIANVNHALAGGDINAAMQGIQGIKGNIPSAQAPNIQPPSVNVPAGGGRRR